MTDALSQDAANPTLALDERMGAFMQLAALDYSHGRHAAALDKYAVLHEHYFQTKQPALQGLALLGAGETLDSAGDPHQAKLRLQQGIALGMANASLPLLVNLLAAVARVCMKLGQFDEAESYCDSGIKVAAAAINPFAYCDFHARRGDAEVAQGKLAEGIASYNRARELCRANEHLATWREVLWNLVGERIDPLGNTTQYRWSNLEQIVALIDPLGNETRLVYDQGERLAEVWRGDRKRDTILATASRDADIAKADRPATCTTPSTCWCGWSGQALRRGQPGMTRWAGGSPAGRRRRRASSTGLARYLQPDPIGYRGSEVNLYGYCPNPLVGVDLLGLAHKNRSSKNSDEGSSTPSGQEKPPVVLTERQARTADSTGYYVANDGTVRRAPTSYVSDAPVRTPAERAAALGYDQRVKAPPFDSHGQPVYTNGRTFITPDVDGHNTSNGWKMFDRRGNRTGTHDANLTRLKD